MIFQRAWRKLMFADSKSIVRKAKEKILAPEDMPILPTHLSPWRLPIAEESIDKTSGKKLVYSLFPAFRKVLVPAYSLLLCYTGLNLLKPLLIHQFVARISTGIHDQQSLLQAAFYAILLGAVSFSASLFLQHYFFRILGVWQVVVNLINRFLYRQSLELTQKARSASSVGDIVNHMSSDTDALSEIPQVAGDLLNASIMIIGVACFLFYYLGFTAIVSFILLLLLVPLTKKVAKQFSHLDEELMKHRDQRVTLISQALNGIRVVKYFAWEPSVKNEVKTIRTKELSARKKLAQAESMATLSYTAISTVVLFVSLAVHSWRGHALSPELAFTCVALFGLLEDPFAHLSEYISRVANGFVGADRICRFLQQESRPPLLQEEGEAKPHGLSIQNLSVQFEGQPKQTLRAVNVQLLPGETLAIVGAVGAGKSTLLQAILHELPFQTGSVSFLDIWKKTVSPRIAFVPQDAFIMNGSVKENILFGENCNDADLQSAIRVSCFDTDIQQLPGGLFTEIGERGVNLSGGQKQRISLARAVVRKPTLALLDDPLSAVDSHTEEQLIDRLLFGYWSSVTKIIVTHRLAHIHRFSKIAFLENGEITHIGTFSELMENSKGFSNFYQKYLETETNGKNLHVTKESSQPQSVNMSNQKGTRITDDEDRAVGAVRRSIYWDYLRALGGQKPMKRYITLFLLVGGTVTGSTLPLLQKSWLALITNIQAGASSEHFPLLVGLASQQASALGIYGALGVITLAGVLLNRLFWLRRGIAAGRDLHDQMLNSVLRAPLRFFDSTPAGRILQRFSRDVESVDIHLQWCFEFTVRCLVNMITTIVLILGVLPILLVVLAPVVIFYYLLQRDYRIPAREAKRLDSISRSPRFAHFKETLQGLVVIRSFGKSTFFTDKFLEKLEFSQRMFYGHYMLNRWFSSRIPLLGGAISAASSLGIVYYAYLGKISPGVAGLVVVYSMSLLDSLNWLIRIFSEMEAKMTSVERIKFYSNLEQELDTKLPPRVADNWPTAGEIVFDRVVARYSPHLPPVLKGITFHVPAGAKVGIIGRTGSGKSTLLQALFRCMELESGEIRIDGTDIARIPLARLRKNIAIIPQDPTLFMGTLRSNLDRYNEYSDAEIWSALQKAKLEDYVRSQKNGLDAAVSESGTNLSQGQRQLMCLARALLASAKILVMDEATASVDVKTDSLVQEVIRDSFQGVTLVVIAHRLGTVADCDMIFEVREGKLHRTLNLKQSEIEAPIC